MALTAITQARYERKSDRYATDLTDQEWVLIGSLLPPSAKGWGCPRKVRWAFIYGHNWLSVATDLPPEICSRIWSSFVTLFLWNKDRFDEEEF